MSMHETLEFCRNKVAAEGKQHAECELCFTDGGFEIRLQDTKSGGMTVLIEGMPVIKENKNKMIVYISPEWIRVERYRLFKRF